MNRRDLANRAMVLAGGTAGLSIYWDPDGFGQLVTEGRWRDKDANGHYISCCQDLATRLALEACDVKQGMSWCNRVDAGNRWIPGWNLIRAKQHAAYAWRGYSPGTKWDIRIGDAVEVQNAYGPHVFVVCEITYDSNGNPVTCDHADFGQYHIVNGKSAGPSARVYLGHPIGRDPLRNWRINNNRIIGRLDIMALRARETGLDETESSPIASPPPAPDTRVTDPPPPDPSPAAPRSLKFCVRGDDVLAWQRRLNKEGAGLKEDSIYGAKTKKATQAWQTAHGIVADGIVGPKTRDTAGM